MGLFTHSKTGRPCFDIGANIGRKTDIFLKLGATVVAVEPHPECFKFLTRKYRHQKRVTLLHKALDEKVGKKDLFLCDANALSTMSTSWIEFWKRSGEAAAEFNWDNKIEIDTITVDDLIREYGRPNYCKIDVEGYEDFVIRGLSQSIPNLSFEYVPATVAATRNCLKRLSNLGFVLFNLSEGECPKNFSSEQWMPFEKIMAEVDASFDRRSGEIYARSLGKSTQDLR